MDDDTTEIGSGTPRAPEGDGADKPARARRPAPISWRPPAAKRAELEAMIAASGLSIGAFLTEAVFGRTRHRPAEVAKLAEILRECQSLADSLRSIARASQDGEAVQISEMQTALTEIRSALFLLMGRTP